MTESSLVDRARESRRSGAVLKVSISNIRSRDRSIPILVFEGRGDLGPYRVWISRIRDDLKYARLKAEGKDQVLDLRDRLSADTGKLRAGVYFFIDRDYDDLKGRTSGPDLFCTETYSIENALVSEEVLQSILEEELQCSDEVEQEAIKHLFREITQQFSSSMREPNRRIFYRARLGIRAPQSSIDECITRYVDVSLTSVTMAYSEEGLRVLVPMTREPSAAEAAELDPGFNELCPQRRHRGKFLLSCFLRWVELLAAERKRPGQTLFAQTMDVRFSSQKLALDSLAGRSALPNGLRDFIAGIVPEN